MITAREMNALGLPNHPDIMPKALKEINQAVGRGRDRELTLRELADMISKPAAYTDHDLLAGLAGTLIEAYPDGVKKMMRQTPAPWRRFGEINLEDSAVRQMEDACWLPNAVRGALMPDAHTGYGLPIGGVLALKGAVAPYAVGVDIACRMRLTVTDLPLTQLKDKRDGLITALETQTRFGIGAAFEGSDKRSHEVMDEDWVFCKVIKDNKDKAFKQLGSSGGGNHFVEFGELTLPEAALGLDAGTYLALLSHSGSRGTGESVALHYSKLAQSLLPGLPDNLRNLAWLDLDSEAGREYWAAMNLMGRYASANHELIHAHILKDLGAQALTFVENHHNFAWEEEHDGEPVIVHRKGATPASPGILGIVPGSMGAPGFIVQGKGQAGSLNSCSHGAGRLMSRTAAIKKFNEQDVRQYLRERNVHLISGGLDEAPMAYKDINAVMAAQADLVDILARFDPRIVKMAPPETRGRRGRKNK